MAAGPEFYQSEEKKSYSTVFLLVVGLLLACTIWAIWQDSFSRHLWKKIKADFYRFAIARYDQEKVDEEKRLAGIPDYVTTKTEFDKIEQSLAGGDAGSQLKKLQADLHDAEIHVLEKDLDLRIVK